MPTIKVNSKGKTTKLEVKKGSNLMFELFKARYEVYSPCGGNGTCGKCKVYIKDEGYVTSCLYTVKKDIELSLPGKAEAKILVSQYEHTRQLPLDPGKSLNLSSYPLGIAIDIGTTTIVFYLVNLITGALVETRAAINPQLIYGADVISRINYCIEHEEGLEKIQHETIRIINTHINEFVKTEEVSKNEIVKITVSGNTTMLHFLLGKDPSSLAFVPFKPVFTDQINLTASSLHLLSNPDAEVIILPSISAYIGADIVCGLSTLQDRENVNNYLFIDIGTNGEMALVTPKEILACATAAGPAFEGANISSGMPALEGAISAFTDGGYRTIGELPPEGICGSGLIDIVAYLSSEKKVKADGELENEFILHEEKGLEGKRISITQKDIRELQLAKSAIKSGIRILIKESGLEEDEIDAVYLAGGFGNYINVESAIQIGLFPPGLKSKVIAIGNASGTGAVLALKSESFYKILQSNRQKTRNIELSEHEDFAIEFAMNMAIDDIEE